MMADAYALRTGVIAATNQVIEELNRAPGKEEATPEWRSRNYRWETTRLASSRLVRSISMRNCMASMSNLLNYPLTNFR